MIKVLIVDDSSFMRKSLTYILKSDRSIEVVGQGINGKEAIEKVRQFHPDVVLLDIEMPVMDGLTALSYIMAECPTPVLMLSGLNKTDATIAIRSLDYGAVDFIPKPSGVISYDIDKLSSEIIAKVKTSAGINVHKLKLNIPKESLEHQLTRSVPQKKIIVIGASTGGPRAVSEVLSSLPRDISTAIVVVQHMNREFIPSFVDRLNYGCSLNISIAENNEIITPGKVFIAPEGCYLNITEKEDAMKICLTTVPSTQTVFHSIDHVMESAARAYGKAALGVLLTGLGDDGARGMMAIKEAGGNTIAEDQSSCVVFGMPKAAIDLGCVDKIVPLPRIARTILRMI